MTSTRSGSARSTPAPTFTPRSETPSGASATARSSTPSAIAGAWPSAFATSPTTRSSERPLRPSAVEGVWAWRSLVVGEVGAEGQADAVAYVAHFDSGVRPHLERTAGG